MFKVKKMLLTFELKCSSFVFILHEFSDFTYKYPSLQASVLRKKSDQSHLITANCAINKLMIKLAIIYIYLCIYIHIFLIYSHSHTYRLAQTLTFLVLLRQTYFASLRCFSQPIKFSPQARRHRSVCPVEISIMRGKSKKTAI